MSVPFPEAYVAILSNPPTSRASSGAAPEYETSSPKLTVILTVLPTAYRLLAAAAVTRDSLTPSTSMTPSPAASRPSVPGSGRSRIAARPSRLAVMGPPLAAKADADV